jgi:hypothetical protein
MQTGIAAMRGAGDRLTKRFGNDAGELFNESIDAFERAAAQALADAADEQH